MVAHAVGLDGEAVAREYLPRAMGYAATLARGRGQEALDVAKDAATTTIVLSLKHFPRDP